MLVLVLISLFPLLLIMVLVGLQRVQTLLLLHLRNLLLILVLNTLQLMRNDSMHAPRIIIIPFPSSLLITTPKPNPGPGTPIRPRRPSTSLIGSCSLTTASSSTRTLSTCGVSEDCVSCSWAWRSVSAAGSGAGPGTGLLLLLVVVVGGQGVERMGGVGSLMAMW